MKIKSFIAPTVQEALSNIKKEMGESSLILETRNIEEADIKGRKGQTLVEIVAAENVIDKSINKELEYATHLSAFPKATYNVEKDLPDAIKELYHRLLVQQVENEHAQTLIKETLYKLKDNGFENRVPQTQVLRERLISKIKVSNSGLTNENPHKIMAFTGTSGVGKTSIITKLSSNARRASDKDILLINIKDGFVERLISHAKKIGAKVAVVTTPKELGKIIEKFANSAHIFIDTPGINHFNNTKLMELKEYIYDIPNLETHLVVSATTRFADNINIIRKFAIMQIHRLLFTKVDETDIYGTLLSIAMETQIPISYISDGQINRESIRPATTNMIAKMVLR